MAVLDRRKLPLGQIVITRSALYSLPSQDVHAALRRHAAGDWGDVNEDDSQANESALVDGSRLFSAYHATDGTKFWIITEADRSATTILLPEDY
ncbi:MAG: type I restriction endonuclease subunit M [Pirellulaceae bacterium]